MSDKQNKEVNDIEKKSKDDRASVEELQKKIEEFEKQKAEYLAGWQRERADFLNYKKEEMERISGLIAYSNEEIIMNFLPILDNFDIAEKELNENLKKDANVQGLLMIGKQIRDFLKLFGVEEIKSVGEIFDPHFHEIVGEKPPVAAQGQKSGVIFEEIQKGYMINSRLLRPAKVKVTK